MTTFVDTSALYALVAQDDPRHVDANAWFVDATSRPLRTHHYVVVETVTLVHRRLGAEWAGFVLDRLLPAIESSPVGSNLHGSATDSYRRDLRRGTSLVDHVSFAFMREHGITDAFAFDEDFAAAGFTLVPG